MRSSRLLLVVAFLLVFCSASQRPLAAPLPSVHLFIGVDPAFAPVFLADARGFFSNAGVNVTVTTFSSGAAAMDALRSARAGFVVAGDLPSIRNWVIGDVVGLAPVNRIPKNISIIVNRDIKTVQDLRRKKVAVTMGATHEIFFAIYLDKNGIPADQIEIVNLAPADMPAALFKNDVQAYVASRPAIVVGLRAVPGSHLIQEGNSPYLIDRVILSASRTMTFPIRVAVLRGLYQGTKFFYSSPDESYKIIAERLSLTPDFVRDNFKAVDYATDLTYTKEFVDHMTSVSTWGVRLGILKEPVDLKRQFDTRPLRAVNKDLVTGP